MSEQTKWFLSGPCKHEIYKPGIPGELIVTLEENCCPWCLKNAKEKLHSELEEARKEIEKWRKAAESKEGYQAGWLGHTIAVGGDPLRRLHKIEDELASKDAKLGKAVEVIELIGGLDCTLAPWKGSPCGKCVSCLARNTLAEIEGD